MIPRWRQLQLPGGAANDNADTSLDAFMEGATLPRTTAPQRELARREHEAHGRAARTSGAEGEAWVDVHHARAVGEGLLVRVWHVGAPSTPYVKGGKVQFDHRRRLLAALIDVAPPDYLGVLADGRALVVEAKHRSGRLHRDRRRPNGTEDFDAIDVHQVADLRRVAAAPCLALVVVAFERARETVRIAAPWAIADTRWRSPRGGAPSLGPEDLEDFRVEGDCYLLRFIEPPR